MGTVRQKGMKYQTRMVIYYTSIALILSFVLGLTVFWSGLHEQYREKEARLSVTSRQIAAQMEDRLRKMDVVMNYLISDPDFLRDITLLGIADAGEDASGYLYEAAAEVNVTLTTDYIVRNTYRAVFFNQTGYLLYPQFQRRAGQTDCAELLPGRASLPSPSGRGAGEIGLCRPPYRPLRLSGRRGGVFVDKGATRLSDGISGSGERHFRSGFPAKS